MKLEEIELSDILFEVTAKRTVVVRNGKRKVKYSCPSGYTRKGKSCVKQSQQEKNKRKRAGKKANRKGKAARKRSRARSMRKRKNM